MSHQPVNPLKFAVQEIDENSWLICGEVLLSRQSTPLEKDQPSWSDGDGGYFCISKAATPLPETKLLPEDSVLENVYDAGGVSYVLRAGEAFIKLHRLVLPEATPEHVTLQHVGERLSTLDGADFTIPKVHYQADLKDDLGPVYCLILGRMPGMTLSEVWPTLEEVSRQGLADRVANICETLFQWKGDCIAGVDGGLMKDYYLHGKDDTVKTAGACSPGRLLDNCKAVGMDCTELGFYHCDLGPGNILFDVETNSIGIIDWETAGFVPKDWLRTKFRLCSGMDLPSDTNVDYHDWRRRMHRTLEGMGYGEVADVWMEWRGFA